MRIAALWATLILAHSSKVIVGSQYVGHFSPQRPPQNYEVGENGSSGKRANAAKIASTNGINTNPAEPTCEELRAMWRYSKRQSRAAESTNELPMYRDPFSYNVWDAYPSRTTSGLKDDYMGPARSRSAGGAPIYGKIIHKAPAGSRLRNGMPDRAKAFEEVTRLYGTVNRHAPSQRRRLTSFRVGGSGGGISDDSQVPQAGSFQHLKEIILAERARELQERRRAEELAERAAALRDVSFSERRSGDAQDARHAKYLSSLQGPKMFELSQSRYAPDIGHIDNVYSRPDQYSREYVLR